MITVPRALRTWLLATGIIIKLSKQDVLKLLHVPGLYKDQFPRFQGDKNL